MAFFESKDLLTLTFLIVPLFLSGIIAYCFTVQKYGSIINKPPWKKTVGAIIGITFYGIVMLFFWHDYFLQKKYGSIAFTIIILVLAIIAIFLSKFIPRFNEWFESAAKIKTSKEKEEKKRRQKKTASASREITVNYIGVVLTTFSHTVFTLFIICSIILRTLLLSNDKPIDSIPIDVTLAYWEKIAIGVSIIAISIYFHTIYVSLASPKQIPNDTELNNVKERLTD